MPALGDLIKELIWPAVALLAGWLVNRALQQRTEMQQTLQLMLPKIHENAEKYYMPLCARILRLEEDWHKLNDDSERAGKSRWFDVLFCDLWILLALDKSMTDAIGGWYLKDREGEEQAFQCWDVFKSELETRFNRDRNNRIVRAIMGVDEYDILLEHFEETGATNDDSSPWPRLKKAFLGWGHGDSKGREELLKDAWFETKKDFRKWVDDDFGKYMIFLTLLRKLLNFEMNRPYETWYGGPAEFPKDFGETYKKLEDWASAIEQSDEKDAGKIREICRGLRNYELKNQPAKPQGLNDVESPECGHCSSRIRLPR